MKQPKFVRRHIRLRYARRRFPFMWNRVAEAALFWFDRHPLYEGKQ